MGGGKDQKTANKRLEEQAGYQSTQQGKFDTRNETDLNESRGRADQLYGDLYKGYSSLAGGNGPAGGGSGSYGGGGGVGWAPDARFQETEDSYRNFKETGGWTPEQEAQQQGRVNSLTEIGKTGGWSEEEKARARGGGVYDEYAKTGGMSAQDIANMRTRATSGVPAMYAQMKAQADRGASIQGGYGPGRAAMASRLGRQTAGDIAGANLNAETDIQGIRDKNRQWGAGGMSGSELALQDQLQRNKLQGLTGASDIYGNMRNDINRGKMWGTEGIGGLAENERQAQLQASSANAAGGRWASEFAAQQQLAGLQGLGDLYTSNPSEYMTNKNFALDSAQTYGGQIGSQSTQLKSGNRRVMDDVIGMTGAVAGGLSGLGGLGMMTNALGGGGGAGAANQFIGTPTNYATRFTQGGGGMM